ncbi:MAG: CHAP domain-containing protein [Halobacteriovoraceae bacterium]|nr:CHAP domain-containing protein [Halobacteriovoraceae bacterium]
MACNFVTHANEQKKMPQQCLSDCKTPYGQELGATKDGIKAYSNCQSSCVIFEPNHYKKVYTGIKWQCVEYARRWLLTKHGVVYGDVDYAYNIWDKIKTLKSPKEFPKKELALKNIINGEIKDFRVGDLIIYGKEFLTTGHIAVVIEYNEKESWIKVAEENYANTKWPGNYARRIPLQNIKNKLTIDDQFVLGIKRIVYP